MATNFRLTRQIGVLLAICVNLAQQVIVVRQIFHSVCFIILRPNPDFYLAMVIECLIADGMILDSDSFSLLFI